jgi:hypothetical protein
MWIDLLNEGISLLLLIGLGLILYQGFKKNQTLLSEREELLKRYLLFRGDKQVRLKVYREDENLYRELLKTVSNSWKNFKKAYDECLHSFAQNTAKTKFFLQIITLCLLINSARLLVVDFTLYGQKNHILYTIIREFSSYVLVILSFSLLRTQTHRLLSLKGEAVKIDRDILFYQNNLSDEVEKEVLYNEFDPFEKIGAEDGK